MSDDFDMVKGGGVGAALMAFIGALWAAFMRKSEKDSDKVEADKEARLDHLEKRLEGALANHAERISRAELRLENVDTRLRSREGLQGEQHTSVFRLSPEAAALIAEHSKK